MGYLTPIDPHVHMRGKEYATIPYAEWAIRDADSVGLSAILEQPNPQPWLISDRTIMERDRQMTDLYNKLYEEGSVSGVPHYGAHIGMTTDFEQAVLTPARCRP